MAIDIERAQRRIPAYATCPACGREARGFKVFQDHADRGIYERVENVVFLCADCWRFGASGNQKVFARHVAGRKRGHIHVRAE